MPTLEELNKLKTHINELGDEPRLLEERGESLGDISPSDSPVDADLEQLLVDDSSGGGINEMEALLGSYADDIEAPDQENEDFSLDDFSLDDLAPPDDIGELDSEEPVLPQPDDDFALEDLDFGDAAVDLPEENIESLIPSDEIPADDSGFEDVLSDETLPGEEPLEELQEELQEEEQSDEEPIEQEFSLDDLDLDDETPSDEADVSGDDIAGDDIVGDLEDLSSEGSESFDDVDKQSDIPDVESAVEELGDLDSMDDDSGNELSLDEELNFEEELGADVLSDIRDVDDDSQQFSMDDFGDQYNFTETDEAYSNNLDVDLEQLEQSLDEAVEGETKPFSIEEEDFFAIRQTLAALPRNLKIAIEELLADDRRNPEDLKPLIDALITGESPKSLVNRFSTLTKRKIELPKSYEKRSGQALEDRKASLIYKLVREGWPVIRVILLVISIGWMLGAAVFSWVYRPLKANSLYIKGLEAIAVDDIEAAEMYFHDAWDGWPLFYSDDENSHRIADSPIVVKGWKRNDQWLEYAAALRRRKHWDAAEQFYEGYLRVKPDSKEVRLEYSRFLSSVLGKYQEALTLLEEAPVRGVMKWDRDYTLATGDVLLDWAEDDPTKYEKAREHYAKVLEISRNDERAFLSMMRYHLRLNDGQKIEEFLPIFDDEVPGRTDVPELAAEVYAGLGKYHLARADMKEARRFINLSLAADPQSPEPPFVDAEYWRLVGDKQRELAAYRRTLVNLEGHESMSRKNLKIRILTLGGMGRIQAANGDFSVAVSSYNKAIDLFEDARTRNQLGSDPAYGRLYLELGNLKYQGLRPGGDLPLTLVPMNETLTEGMRGEDRESELDLAELNYDKAENLYDRGSSGFGLPSKTLYRRAYVRYLLNKDDALLDFHRVARQKPEDYEVRIALATVLLSHGDYEASRSQYARAIELLDEELKNTGGTLKPFERQSHADLLIRYIISWNNLGVGRARSAARGGGEDDYAAALSAFTMASEYFDEVYNDMTDLNNRGVTGLRDDEDRRIISEEDGYRLYKETATYPYLNRLRLLGLDSAVDGEDAYLMYPDIPSDLLDR